MNPTNHPSELGVDSAQAGFTSAQLAALARQHTHDLLNELNSFEVELTLPSEMTEEPETRESVARLREIASRSAKRMRTFLPQLITEDRSLIPAFELLERWKADAATLAKGNPVTWDVALGDSTHATEVRVIRSLLNEMLSVMVATLPGQTIRIHCWNENGQAIYEVSATREASTHSRNTEFQVSYWSALERLAARNGGVLTPLPTDPNAPTRVALTLPILSLGGLFKPS